MKISHSGKKDVEACDDDGLYVDFNMDEVDLSIENYEELFDGIDCLLGGAESNCHGSYVAKMQEAGKNEYTNIELDTNVIVKYILPKERNFVFIMDNN
uniref:Uncharacterized protein n=1 Tax=Lactuca sativa TaxID=4236 RepID=A0A9R1V6Y0_LACSA|nr:hypothetical protein LSAT_V11C600329010 [Lactuca sativa]